MVIMMGRNRSRHASRMAGQVEATGHKGQQRADAGGRQRREDRQRVDPAFVEHPQHDVDDNHRRQNQPWFGNECGLELGGVSGITAGDGRGQADLLFGFRNGCDGLTKRESRRKVEADRGGGELLLMGDDQRGRGSGEAGNGR